LKSENTIPFQHKASYYSIGQENKKLIFVLHGYGQLARYFISQFEPLTEEEFCVVAPEGLHRFYLHGNNGRVGASWMTKENRELDIENYITYLNELYASLVKDKIWDRIIVLGFSQGVATAFRWVANGKIKPNELLLCSGMIPPDVNLDENNHIFNSIKMTYLTGKQDPYRTEEAVISFQKRLQEISHPIGIVEFEGKHEVSVEEVLKLL
jgi:predicted esterase